MKTMTVRNIPDDVAVSLANLAKAGRRSVNATVVDVLAAFAKPRFGTQKKYADFSEFVGRWSNEKANAIEREIDESFEKIDPEDRK